MLWKLKLAFVMPDLENPKQIGFLWGLWGSDIPSINLIAVKLLLSRGNGC